MRWEGNMTNNYQTPPRLALFILSIILPKHLYDNVVGDLIEEYAKLSELDKKQAELWFWQQTIQSTRIYALNALTSKSMYKLVNTLFTSAILLTCLFLVSWLSKVDTFDSFSLGLWDRILSGQAHSLLAEPTFWQTIPSLVPTLADCLMFIDLPAIMISATLLGALYWLNSKFSLSAAQVALIGYGAMFSPYLYSLTYLSSNTLAPHFVGPFLACGLLSIFYMLLPVSHLVNQKLNIS